MALGSGVTDRQIMIIMKIIQFSVKSRINVISILLTFPIKYLLQYKKVGDNNVDIDRSVKVVFKRTIIIFLTISVFENDLSNCVTIRLSIC